MSDPEISIISSQEPIKRIFSKGRSIRYKSKGVTRATKDIRTLKGMTWNLKDYITRQTDEFPQFGRIEKDPFKLRLKREGAQRRIKAADPDYVVLQEVIDIQSLISDFPEYKILVIDDTWMRQHKIAYMVKKDLPFEFELHSHKHIKEGGKSLFIKDLPVLTMRDSDYFGEDPFLIVMGAHVKATSYNPGRLAQFEGVPEAVAKRLVKKEADEIREKQFDVINSLKNQYEDYFGENTTILIQGDFNRSIHQSKDIIDLRRNFFDAFEISRNKLPIHDRNTKVFNKSFSSIQQYDAILANQFVRDNRLLKNTNSFYDYKDGKMISLDKAVKSNQLDDFDHAPITTQIDLNYLKRIKEKSTTPFDQYDVIRDAMYDDEKALAIFKLITKAESEYKIKDLGQFIKGLNKIHHTGIKKEGKLDFSKGRMMVEFLDNFSINHELRSELREEIRDLAKRGILGRPSSVEFDNIAAKHKIWKLNKSTSDPLIYRELKDQFGPDYLYKVLVSPKGNVRRAFKNSYRKIVLETLKERSPKINPRDVIKYTKRVLDDYDRMVLNITDRKTGNYTEGDKIRQFFYTVPQFKSIYLKEINKLRSELSLPPLQKISPEEMPDFVHIKPDPTTNYFPADQ